MASIRISNNLTLPADTVTQAVAILAKRRMGKSYLARKFAEGLHAAGQQLVIVDPKGDWWGIRSSADGKSDGLPILIIGGEHGDIPLDPRSGETIAKLVVEERVSALLDLSELRKHEIATFMPDFMEPLYRLKAREQYRTPLMMINDEADALAPQKPQPNEARMVGAYSDLVRRGGQRGIGVTSITQRSAVLSKDILTQSQILITLRVIAPQDLAAIKAWVDVHGTIEEQKTLMQSLPSLPVGDAWVWSPGWPTDAGIFERIHTLPIATYDSGATPKPGQKAAGPKRLADIDLDAVKRQMGEALDRAKADDPKTLRARIAELEEQLAAAPAAEPERVEVPVFNEEEFEGLKASIDQELVDAAIKADSCRDLIKRLLVDYQGNAAFDTTMATPISARAPAVTKSKPPEPQRNAAAISAHARAVTNGAGTSDEKLTPCERQMLTALAQHGQLALAKITILTGYSKRSSTPGEAASRLRGAGLVDGSNVGGMTITRAGLKALGPFERLPTGPELARHWFEQLTPCEGAILKLAITRYPRTVSLNQAREAANYSASSSTPGEAASKLRKLGLIVGPNAGFTASEGLAG